jgi:hypothetical protein
MAIDEIQRDRYIVDEKYKKAETIKNKVTQSDYAFDPQKPAQINNFLLINVLHSSRRSLEVLG